MKIVTFEWECPLLVLVQRCSVVSWCVKSSSCRAVFGMMFEGVESGGSIAVAGIWHAMPEINYNTIGLIKVSVKVFKVRVG